MERGTGYTARMIQDIFFALVGLVILTLAADKLVEGAASLARRVGISPLVVGLTIVAMGTSAPELVVSIQSSWEGNPGIAVGNVVGSNIFNIAAILGIAALIRPIAVSRPVIRRDLPVMIISAFACQAAAYNRVIDRSEALLMLVAMIGYTVYSIRSAQTNPEEAPPEEAPAVQLTLGGELLRIILGLVALVDLLLGGLGAWINPVFGWQGQWSLKALFGYLFYPVTLILGVPVADVREISQIVGERLIVTEVAAYNDLAAAMKAGLVQHPRSAVIATYALCGFAHIASMAIFVGSLCALAPQRTQNIGPIAVRALIAATLACLMTACVAGTFFTEGSILLGGS